MNKLSTLYFLLICGVFSCINAPEFPITPAIEYRGLSKYEIKQSSVLGDSLRIYFDFTDGDGDIGTEGIGFDIFIIDTRTGNVHGKFKAPPVPEKGTKNGIEGTAEVTIYATCCLYPDNTPPCEVNPMFPRDSLQFEVYMFDRAGHESNHIITDWLYLRCE